MNLNHSGSWRKVAPAFESKRVHVGRVAWVKDQPQLAQLEAEPRARRGAYLVERPAAPVVRDLGRPQFTAERFLGKLLGRPALG